VCQMEECRVSFEASLPRIRRHAEIQFRSVRCEELTAEALALSWILEMVAQALGTRERPPPIRVRDRELRRASGAEWPAARGPEKAKDVLSPVAQKQK